MAFRALLSLSLAAASTASLFPSVESRLFQEDKNINAVSFSLSKTLGDHMVLQRGGKGAIVWGFATVGTSVKTTFQGKSYQAIAGADTVWRQELPPQPETTVGQTISFSTDSGDSATLNDVLFGDVFFCSGQSNVRVDPAYSRCLDLCSRLSCSYPADAILHPRGDQLFRGNAGRE
jgi:hypothetical protein